MLHQRLFHSLKPSVSQTSVDSYGRSLGPKGHGGHAHMTSWCISRISAMFASQPQKDQLLFQMHSVRLNTAAGGLQCALCKAFLAAQTTSQT